MSRLPPIILGALVACGFSILIARVILSRRLRQREALLGEIADLVAAATNGASGSALLASGYLKDEISQVIAAYRETRELAARVAELEVELAAVRVQLPMEEIEEARTEEPDLILDQARRLTESSFLAGSDALVRVRAAVKNLQDWRLRLVANEEQRTGPEPITARPDAGPGSSSGAASNAAPGEMDGDAPPVAAVFSALSMEIAELAAQAKGLKPLADATEAIAGLRPRGVGAGQGDPASVPGWNVPAQVLSSRRLLLLTALKLRGLAAEIETGLVGVSAELRVLGTVPASKLLQNGRRRQPARVKTDPAFVRALSRLETQLSEVAHDIASLTRDAEHLSRELGRVRSAPNGRHTP